METIIVTFWKALKDGYSTLGWGWGYGLFVLFLVRERVLSPPLTDNAVAGLHQEVQQIFNRFFL